MNNVLMVGFNFPPLGGSGGHRMVKFVKYLPSYGWKPLVLASRSWIHHTIDESLWKEVPDSVVVYRSRVMEPDWSYVLSQKVGLAAAHRYLTKFFLLPDEKIGWLPFAYRKGLEIAQKVNFDAVYSTSGPFTSHLIAARIAGKLNKPWVADFRDEWLEWPSLFTPTPVHRLIHRRLEATTLNRADRIVTTSESMTTLFQQKIPKRASDVTTITNGYDRTDFDTKPIRESNNDRFVLTHVGSLWPTQDISPVLRAVRSLLDSKRLKEEEIELRFVGLPGPPESLVRNLGLEGVVKDEGFLPHKAAINSMSDSTCLLLLVSPARNLTIPEKTFEYLATGKPILAVVPPTSESADLIKRTKSGVIADYCNQKDIEAGLLSAVSESKKRVETVKRDECAIASYERKELAGQLAKVFDSLIQESRQSQPDFAEGGHRLVTEP